MTCKSNGASVFFMSREDFVKSVNLYKFSDQILTEKCLKQHILDRRIGETLTFLKSDAVQEPVLNESHEEKKTFVIPRQVLERVTKLWKQGSAVSNEKIVV